MPFKMKFLAKSPFKADIAGGNTGRPKKDPYAEALKRDSKLPEYIKQRKGLQKGSAEYAKVQNKINAAYGVSKRHTVKKTTVQKAKPSNVVSKSEVKTVPVRPQSQTVKKENKKITKAVSKGNMKKAAKLAAIASQPGTSSLEKRLNYKGQKARERKAARQEKRANRKKNK